MTNIWRVVGCPGAGKTRYLSQQAERAADKHGASNVAIASLTRTAATEIGQRVSSVAGGIPEQNCATLHAHCYRALDTPTLAETTASMREFATAHPELTDEPEHHASGDELDDMTTAPEHGTHAAVMNHRARLDPVDTWTDDERTYHAAWQDFKQQTDRMDFTDLIEQAVAQPDLLPPVKALLADEAQDFSALELQLLQAWAARTQTTVAVGDLDQVLYQWRGAGGLDALDVAGEQLLTQSYRCSAAVAELAQDWIGRLPGRHIVWAPTDQPGHAATTAYSLREPDELVDEALTLDGDVMILATCGYMLEPLIRELRDRGIPYHNSYRTKGRQGAAWNPLRSKTTTALAAYLRPHRHAWGDRARAWTWGDLHAWTEPLQATALERGAKASIAEHVRPDQFGQTRATEPAPIQTMVTLMGEQVVDAALAGDIDWWRSSILAKHARSGAYACSVAAATPAAIVAPVDEDWPVAKITVGTVHSVKGGQTDHVILSPELSKEAYWQGWHGNNRAAVIRTLYVGITRARHSARVMESSATECAPLDDLLRKQRVGRMAA